MSNTTEVTYPKTHQGQMVRKYVAAQEQRDFSDAANIFTQDVVFNDVMFPITGLEKVSSSLQDYVKSYLSSYRVEAVNETRDADSILVLYWMKLNRDEKEFPVCDLVSLRDGKICRVDNCFNAGRFKTLQAHTCDTHSSA